MNLIFLAMAIVQAATEFLPVSSSGHLLFIKGLSGFEIPLIFDIVLHVASLIAIIIFYRRKIAETVFQGMAQAFKPSSDRGHFKFLLYAVISTVVTFAFYLLFQDPIESEMNKPSSLWWSFLMTSAILASTYWIKGKRPRRIAEMGLLMPIWVGLFQCLAILPAVSRSGATIAALLWLGVDREESVYYAFFLAIPAIAGAFVFKLRDLANMDYIGAHAGIVALAFILAAVASYLFLGLLKRMVIRGRFWIFAVYTFVMSLVSGILFNWIMPR